MQINAKTRADERQPTPALVHIRGGARPVRLAVTTGRVKEIRLVQRPNARRFGFHGLDIVTDGRRRGAPRLPVQAGAVDILENKLQRPPQGGRQLDGRVPDARIGAVRNGAGDELGTPPAITVTDQVRPPAGDVKPFTLTSTIPSRVIRTPVVEIGRPAAERLAEIANALPIPAFAVGHARPLKVTKAARLGRA